MNYLNYNLRMLSSEESFSVENNDEEYKSKIIQDYFHLKISSLLEIVGDEGIYQKFIVLTFSFMQFFFATINFSIPYLFYVPDYYCYDSNEQLYKCRQHEACSNQFGYQVNGQRISLVTDFELYCEDSVYYLRSQSFLFFFGAIIQFLTGFLSDLIGRKRVLVCFSLMYVLAFILYISGNSYTNYILTCFMIFGLYYSFLSIFYIYMAEVMGSKIKNFAGGIGNLGFVLGQYALLLTSKFILDYKNIIIIQFVCTFVIVCSYFFLIESPFFFYRKKNLLQTYKSLKKIAQINQEEEKVKQTDLILQEKLGLKGKNIQRLTSFQIKKYQDKKLSFFQNLISKFTKHDVYYLIGICLLMFQNYNMASILINYPQYIGVNDLYVNIFCIGLGDIIAYINLTFNASKMQRKKSIIILYILEIILGLILFSFKPLGLRHIAIFQVIQLLLAFITRILVCSSLILTIIWTAEIFPTKIRGIVMGISLFFARLSFGVSPIYIYYATKYDINPLSFIVVVTIIPLLYLPILPETLNKKLSN